MATTGPGRERLRQLVGLVLLLMMVGGFTLSFAGTPRYEKTILTWLGYSEYNTLAFLSGVGGLVALVVYGYYVTEQEG